MLRSAAYLVFAAILLGTCGVSWGQMKAVSPTPADGATDVPSGVPYVLQWKSSGTTMQFYTVYLGTSPELGPADIVAPKVVPQMMAYVQMAGFAPGATYYWRVDGTEKDLVTVNTGDVWVFTAQAETAYLPDPVDGSNVVSVTPDLKWLPGQRAVNHHVYLSDDQAAVVDGTAEADKGIVAEPNFAPAELRPATTYFWRVDEILLDDSVVPGLVWSFTTILPIDDFESYTNDSPNRVFQTWIDGYGFSKDEFFPAGDPGNGTGAAVGHDIWAEGTPYTTIVETKAVHGGAQSMPLDYNNINTPFYSEAERRWTTSQDWTINGVDTLTLYVQGRARDFDIQRVATPPVIDGQPDAAWAQATVLPIFRAMVGTVSSPADASGQFRVLYDMENLYVLVDVNDDKLVNDSSSAYLDDSVEFYFDGENTKGPAPLSGHNRQYTFGWTATDIQGTNQDIIGVEFAQVNVGTTGWRLEIKLPWQTLMGTAAPVGKLIGIDCFYNDDDDGGDTREAQISWFSLSGDNWQIPAGWGTAAVAIPGVASGADALYVALQDAANHTGVITNPDAGVLTATKYVEWQIALKEFADAGVNLKTVRKMFIGVGDRANPVKGAGGSLFIDDIYLTRPAPPNE
jgi:hypothetical protein